MNQIKNKKGYTVVETLIVLAVTGALFVTTAVLIQGQVEKNRYQASMRQVPQLIQNVVNDVSNGYMRFSSGTSDTLLIGKKFWFCGRQQTSAFDGCPASNDGQIFYVATLSQGPAPDYTVSLSDQREIRLPDGIEFTHFKSLNTSGAVNSGPVYEFGSRVMFVNRVQDVDNFIGVGQDLLTKENNIKGVALFTRQNFWGLFNATLSQQNAGGFMLCFEGYRKGSVELGSATLGNTVRLNMQDTRCD